MQEPTVTAKHAIFGGATLLLLAIVAYWPAIDGEFLWDGKKVIPENSMITEPGQLWKFWFSDEPEDYWPISNTNYWLQWRLWGYYMKPYHLVSILLHAINAILIWTILKRMNSSGAWIAAAIFAVHPVNVESVAWIIQQKTLLATIFAFAAFLHFLKHQEGQCDFVALIFFLCSLLCKTSAIALPVFFVVFDGLQNGWKSRRMIRSFAPFFLIAVTFGLISIWFMQPQGVAVPPRTDGIVGRFVTAGWAIWFYALKIILPYRLMFVYPRWEIDLQSVLSYLPILAACGVLVMGWSKRQSWGKALLAGWGGFLLCLFPVLGFSDISFMRFSFVADHWQYMATAPLIAMMVSVSVRLTIGTTDSDSTSQPAEKASVNPANRTESVEDADQSPQQSRKNNNLLGSIYGLILIAAFSALGWNRAHIYRNEFTLWLDSLNQNPTSALVYNNLGVLYFSQASPSKGMNYFATAVKHDPFDVGSHVSLSNIYAQQKQMKKAILHLEAALNIHPEMAKWNILLAKYLGEQGETARAIEHYQRAIKVLPKASEQAKLLESAIEMLEMQSTKN